MFGTHVKKKTAQHGRSFEEANDTSCVLLHKNTSIAGFETGEQTDMLNKQGGNCLFR